MKDVEKHMWVCAHTHTHRGWKSQTIIEQVPSPISILFSPHCLGYGTYKGQHNQNDKEKQYLQDTHDSTELKLEKSSP